MVSVHSRSSIPGRASSVVRSTPLRAITPAPRRVSLDRSRSRPRCRRTWTVPSGQPSVSCRLCLGLSLQVAEDDRLAIFLGKPIDFVVKLGMVHDFQPRFRGVAFVRDFGLSAFGRSAPSRLALRASCHAEGDPVQPGAQRPGLSNRSGLPRQDEENGLGRVLRLVRTAEHVETDAVNDRAIPLDESGESGLGCLVCPGKELLQELFVSPRLWSSHDSRSDGPPPVLSAPLVPFAVILSLWDDLRR